MLKPRVNPQKMRGFTLVELLIVIAIIGILASVSINYYKKYKEKSILSSHALPLASACAKDIIAYCIDLNSQTSQVIDISSLNLTNCQNAEVLSHNLTIDLTGTFVCNPGGNVADGKIEAYLEDIKDYKAVCYLKDNSLDCKVEKNTQ
jgi:prepilin-type N-terminal cleavage/methylation domain-containing protein